MEKAKTTPKDFFLWAGAMIALYWSVIAFIFLIFNYIDYTWRSPLGYLAPNPYDSGIGYEMASILVLFPVYLVLMWLIRRDIAHDASRKDIWVRRWALILTLFVAGVTVAGDLISLLTTFFNGEAFTIAFVLKSVVLLLVAAAAFMHFIADLWGYWEQYPTRKRSVGWGAGILAILSIVAGFVLFGTPMQARLYRFDAQKVSDLQQIQSQIVFYWQQKGSLPSTLADLTDPISGFTVPTDPQGGAYTYKRNSPLDFALCATFNTQSKGTSIGRSVPTAPAPYGGVSDINSTNWAHGTGNVCFDRSIDPKLYPIKKQ